MRVIRSWGLLTAGVMALCLAQTPSAKAQVSGVTVRMAVTRNAVAVPDADAQDALVVALTADGMTYVRATQLPTSALADVVKSLLSTRTDKTLYIKADARVPYGRLIEVIDAVQKSGVEGLTLLTAQPDAADQRSRVVPPKGLQMRVNRP